MDLRKGRDKVVSSDAAPPDASTDLSSPADPRASNSASRRGNDSTGPIDAAHAGASAPEGPFGSSGGRSLSSDKNARQRGGASAPEAAAQSAAQKNHWLAIRLVGTKSNRDGIGAHLKLVAGDLTSYDQSKGGMSYCSAQDPRIFFGLGAHARVDSLEIWWPSGLRESLTNLPVDMFLTIEEGKGTAKAVRYPPVKRSK
jgi:hypothetical protein